MIDSGKFGKSSGEQNISESFVVIYLQVKELAPHCPFFHKSYILPLFVKLNQGLYVICKLHILNLQIWVSLPENSEYK